MHVIDLFSGVGGMSLGFKNAGFKSELAIEYNAEIAKGFSHNFPNTTMLVADISQLDLEQALLPYRHLEDLVIIGGPPCQGFSQKGKRIGLEDERNFLFKKFIETIQILRPPVWMIENVPGILSMSQGFFLNEIENEFLKLGYQIDYQILNASDYGVPQSRRRAFIVGHKSTRPFVWPQKLSQKIGLDAAIDDLPKLQSGEGQEVAKYDKAATTLYQQALRKNSLHLFNHVATKHSKVVLERLKLIPEGGTRADLPPEHLTKSIHSGTWCRLDRSKPARTITTRFDTPSSGMFTLPDQDRCLTVREAARLQSFPDHFQFTGNKSNQMLQVGNAVPPLLAQSMAMQIKALLQATKDKPLLTQFNGDLNKIDFKIA